LIDKENQVKKKKRPPKPKYGPFNRLGMDEKLYKAVKAGY